VNTTTTKLAPTGRDWLHESRTLIYRRTVDFEI